MPASTPRPPSDNTTASHTFVSVREAARFLRVTERTVRNYLVKKRRPLPHSKPGGRILINLNQLQEWAHKK